MYERRATKLVEFAGEANKWGKVAEFNIKAVNNYIAATFMVQTIGNDDNNSRYAIFSVNMRQIIAMGKKPEVSITTLLAKNFDDAYFKAMKIMKEDSKCYRVKSIKEVQDIFIIEEND